MSKNALRNKKKREKQKEKKAAEGANGSWLRAFFFSWWLLYAFYSKNAYLEVDC